MAYGVVYSLLSCDCSLISGNGDGQEVRNEYLTNCTRCCIQKVPADTTNPDGKLKSLNDVL